MAGVEWYVDSIVVFMHGVLQIVSTVFVPTRAC